MPAACRPGPFRSPALPEKPNWAVPSRADDGGFAVRPFDPVVLPNTSRPAAPVSGDADPAEKSENLPDADEAVEEDVESSGNRCELLTHELLAERPWDRVPGCQHMRNRC
ncbi:MAG: hypothetical protein ACLUEV_00985 [Alistipes sp.]